MLKTLESIFRILVSLALIASLGYSIYITNSVHEDWKQLSTKVGSAFSENRVTITIELKLPEGSKQEPASATIANAFLQMVLPKKESKPTTSAP